MFTRRKGIDRDARDCYIFFTSLSSAISAFGLSFVVTTAFSCTTYRQLAKHISLLIIKLVMAFEPRFMAFVG